MRSVRDKAKPSRARTVALLAAAGLFVLFLSANGIARVFTDFLWFDALGQESVWSTILTTQLLLVAIFGTAFFAVLWGNLVLADRLKPSLRAPSAEEDLVERYHAAVGVHGGKVRFAIAFLFAFISGANTASQWQSWILFRNGGNFGRTDPLFGRDASFYVFQLPFLSFVVDWVFATMVLTMVVVLIAHYLNGGIRAAAASDRVAAGVKLHLSILLAVLAVLRAGSYWLDRFHLSVACAEPAHTHFFVLRSPICGQHSQGRLGLARCRSWHLVHFKLRDRRRVSSDLPTPEGAAGSVPARG